MSEPTRYRIADNQAQLTLGGGVLVVDPAGPLVEYADYARLKAEVERLISVSEAWKKRRLDKVEAECIKWSDYEKLKADNKRLRKAGDAMAEAMWYGDAQRSIWVKKFAETEWNAAKEGKPSV